jgi:ubiquitin-like-conjugating enzyme ATG3
MEEEYEAAGDEVLLDNDDDGGWLATHGIDRGMEWCSQPNVC